MDLDSSGDSSHSNIFSENEQAFVGPHADGSGTSSGIDPAEDSQGDGSAHGAMGPGPGPGLQLEGVVHVMGRRPGPVAIAPWPAVDYGAGSDDDCAGMPSTSMQGLVHFDRNDRDLLQMREYMLRFHDAYANPCYRLKTSQ